MNCHPYLFTTPNWVDVENTIPASGAWEQVEVDLSGLFGFGLGEVEFRFVARDDGDDSVVEAGIDDFALLVRFRDPMGVDSSPSRRLTLGDPSPNPFGESTAIPIALSSASPVRLTIHDVTGRLVRTLLDGEVLGAGWRTMRWDGLSDSGRPVKGGLYFVQVNASTDRSSRSLVLAR